MKQRISTEQLQELTKDQLQKIREWWVPQTGDFAMFKDGKLMVAGSHSLNLRHARTQEYYPLLSIGQMIEFLDEKILYISLEIDMWEVYTHKMKYIAYNDYELCDALWSAVKEVLSQ